MGSVGADRSTKWASYRSGSGSLSASSINWLSKSNRASSREEPRSRFALATRRTFTLFHYAQYMRTRPWIASLVARHKMAIGNDDDATRGIPTGHHAVLATSPPGG
eukprot:scaffold268421_cov31-Tisochrysis_lutea.AAC.1